MAYRTVISTRSGYMQNPIETRYAIRKIKVDNNVWALLVLLICIFSSIVCCLENKNDLYSLIAIFPIAYAFVFVIFLFPIIVKHRSYTVALFAICCGLRYVLQPILLSLYPIYGFSAFADTSVPDLNKAMFLMLYELIVTSIVLSLFYLRKKPPEVALTRDIDFLEGKSVIVAFIVIAMLVLMLFPRAIQNISFFVLKSNTGQRVSTLELSTFEYLLQQIFQIARLALYVLIVITCKNCYKVNHKKIYIFITLFITLINIGIITGEARSMQVYFAFAATYLMIRCFPEHKKKIIKYVIIAVVIVIGLMTIYKQFYAFRYDSYSSTIANINLDMKGVTQTAEVYLLGPQSVASAMSLDNMAGVFSFDRLSFDFARSFMGIHLFVKDMSMQTTSMIYNLYITKGISTSGYLLPVTAQGYLYFGWLFSPLLLCLFLRLAIYLEDIIRKSESAYVVFFVAYVFIRCATCIVASNINTVITMSSMVLLSAGMVYLGQKCVYLLNQRVSLKQ